MTIFNEKWNRIALGGLIWLIIGGLAWLEVIEVTLIGQFFLLAPLVIMPLGLILVKIPEDGEWQKQLHTLIWLSQPFCAWLVTVAFLLPPGPIAGALALGWLALTGLIALLGLVRFITRSFIDLKAITIDAGLGYLALGGGWLILSRLGLNPLGFDDTIVLLTAVHFHYAGFAAPLFTGLIGYRLTDAPPRIQKLYQFAAAGVIAGTPLVAAGITLSPLLEVIGALILATSLAIIAYLVRVILRAITDSLARIFLTISAICLLIGMSFTYLYAIDEFTGYHLVSIPQMALIHGAANALGFALFGLLGWNIVYKDSLGV